MQQVYLKKRQWWKKTILCRHENYLKPKTPKTLEVNGKTDCYRKNPVKYIWLISIDVNAWQVKRLPWLMLTNPLQFVCKHLFPHLMESDASPVCCKYLWWTSSTLEHFLTPFFFIKAQYSPCRNSDFTEVLSLFYCSLRIFTYWKKCKSLPQSNLIVTWAKSDVEFVTSLTSSARVKFYRARVKFSRINLKNYPICNSLNSG